MEYNFPNVARQLLNDIIGGINTLYSQTDIKGIDECRDSLTSTIQDTFGIKDDVISSYSSFLAKVSILAYFQKFDNDIDLEKKRQSIKSTDTMNLSVDDILGGTKKDSTCDTDFLFGFKGFNELVTSTVEVLTCTENNEIDVSDRVCSNLLTSIRDITVEEYLTGGYIERDIRLVALLGEEPAVNTEFEIMDFIKNDDNYKTLYESAVMSILGVYKYLMQDGLGLREYKGVVSLRNSKCNTISDACKLSSIQGTSTVFKYLSSSLREYYDVNEVGNRQFNIKQIVDSSDRRPFYFPKKILEYAKGRELTYRLSEGIYRPHEDSISWDSYSDSYVEPQIYELILQAIYYSMEKHFDFGKYGINGKDFSSDGFKIKWVTDNASIISDLTSLQMSSEVDADLQRVIKSLCTACIVTDYNNLGGTVNSIKIRIVDTTRTLESSMTSSLFSGCSANKSIKYSDGEVITVGKRCRDGETPLPFDVYEFSHDFNSSLTQAEPLFGYTAVELYRNRGIPISWDRILLGEDIKGTPLFASRVSIDDIPLQANTVHNMMAGSRSGKGVMTMNLLASAIAGNKPIFYIDRKPDMSVMFAELSRGNMFCVNGGQYLQKNDPRGYCGEDGIVTKGWLNAYSNMPRYLKDNVFQSKAYSGKFGDYVYYRAVMFTLSIMLARVELSGTEYYNSLGGRDGIVIVVDEFKNWQENFENTFFSPTGVFGNKNRIDKTAKANFRKINADLKGLRMQLETAEKPDKIVSLEARISAKEEDLQELITPLKAYGTEVMDKYGETIKHLAEVSVAGFKEGEGRVSDIFVIGQHIEIDGYDGSANPSGTYEMRDSELFNVNESTKGKSLMRGVFELLPHDWFMGYNSDKPNYMGATTGRAKRWITDRKYWAYTTSTMDKLRTTEPSGVVYFKPYLVLNNHLEDDPHDRKTMVVNGETVDDPDYTFVAQCRARVNDAVPGANLWEKVRLKHCKKDTTTGEPITAYGNLNEGVGFAGLANLTKLSTGNGEFNPTSDLGKSKVIADFVAQKMGYSDYRELLFDFSPDGLFSSRDVVNAITNPSSFKNKRKVLQQFYKYGLLNDDTEQSDLVYSDRDYDSDGEVSLDDEDDCFVGGTEERVGTTEHHESDWNTDGWQTLQEPEEEQLTDKDIREVCEMVLSVKAKQYGKVLSKSQVDGFVAKVTKLVREGVLQ